MVKALAIDSLNPATLYAVLGEETLYKSLDAGATREPWGTGWGTELPQFTHAVAIAVDPQHPQFVYAGTQDNGIFESADYGNHWSQVRADAVALRGLGPPDATSPLGLAVLYATDADEMFTSRDGGDQWTAISSIVPSLLITSFIADPQTPGTLYVSTWHGGVLMSTDGGRSFQPINDDLPTLAISSIALDPQQSGVLYAGATGYGLYVSRPETEARFLLLVLGTP